MLQLLPMVQRHPQPLLHQPPRPLLLTQAPAYLLLLLLLEVLQLSLLLLPPPAVQPSSVSSAHA
jgi:hypothetical protein